MTLELITLAVSIMTGNTAWHKWSANLAHRLDRDFERACLPFLRLIWPNMVAPTPLSKWDRQGVDLVSFGDAERLECVVQCKTSQQPILGPRDVMQAIDSIDAFRKSEHKCDTYILIINGDGRNPSYNTAVEDGLATLVADGKAVRAQLWPRPVLLNHSFARMKVIVLHALRQRSQERQQIFKEMFRFGAVYLPKVPVKEDELILRPGSPCEKRTVHHVSVQRLTRLLQNSSSSRWTLLTGMFGAGKTTTALEASTVGEFTAIFVPATELGERARRIGTATLSQEVIDALGIFNTNADPIDGFQVRDTVDEETFSQLAGPALASILRNETPEHVLILDGLDENRTYLHSNGFQTLHNQLAEFKCPIVLTTRFEHLSAMFGNFESLLENIGRRGRGARRARLLTLAPWSREEVRRFVEAANREATDEEKEALTHFVRALDSGKLHDLYGDLPFHPLFLQFILEDVCSTGLNARSRTDLIRAWVKRKIWRDVDHHGIPIDHPIDRYEFIDRMLLLTEAVAGEMTTGDTDAQLTETVDTMQVESLSITAFGTKLPIATLLLYGLLVPVGLRKGVRLDLRFSLRLLQEYFLACHLRRTHRDAAAYPGSVRELVIELAENPSSG